ncbi:unnamed protein product [Brachionus calyciflorus]|uniref:Uncharacterized protein n=1 Tax=Brachionus calyciflorus TaxID=104777 RepID=A0A813UHZ7_9BILA|nr:unnamed protein product [Brachionus calyciflorus]
MNKNKQKYISIPQDSFKFNPFSRAESIPHEQPISSFNHKARINELCLKSAENESEWTSYKNKYYKIETITYLFGIVCSILFLSICLIIPYITNFIYLIKFIENWTLFQYPLIYLVIEFSSLLLDLIKLVSIKVILSIFRYETPLKAEEDDGSVLYETINNLNLRCLIREKFKIVEPLLFKLEILINSYYLLFIIIVKYSLAIYLSINLVHIVHLKENEQMTLFCNQTTKLYDSYECLTYIQGSIKKFLIYFIIFLYVTSSLKLLTQTILVVNFKYFLSFCLIKKLYEEDSNFRNEYEECKNRIFLSDLNEKMEKSQEYFANEFFDLNKVEKNEKKRIYINQREESDKRLYLNNFEEPRYLNSDEENAINLIDKAAD